MTIIYLTLVCYYYTCILNKSASMGEEIYLFQFVC